MSCVHKIFVLSLLSKMYRDYVILNPSVVLLIPKTPSSGLGVKNTSNLFCLVQNGQIVSLVVCNGLRWSSRWSLSSARAFSEAFWTQGPVRLVKYTAVSGVHRTVGHLQWKMVFKSPFLKLKSKRLQICFA